MHTIKLYVFDNPVSCTSIYRSRKLFALHQEVSDLSLSGLAHRNTHTHTQRKRENVLAQSTIRHTAMVFVLPDRNSHEADMAWVESANDLEDNTAISAVVTTNSSCCSDTFCSVYTHSDTFCMFRPQLMCLL